MKRTIWQSRRHTLKRAGYSVRYEQPRDNGQVIAFSVITPGGAVWCTGTYSGSEQDFVAKQQGVIARLNREYGISNNNWRTIHDMTWAARNAAEGSA